MTTNDQESSVVKAALERLTVPEDGTVWIGPFEQLHGAGYSLLAATRHGILSRDLFNYHARVRTKIVRLILEHHTTGQTQDKSALDNALAGFYFNAGIQRVVWASERLIKTFVGIKCACGRAAEKQSSSKRFCDLLKAAKVRMEHLRQQEKHEMPCTDAMLSQFPDKEYKHESILDPNFTLAMLRYDVNNRKHSLFGPLVRDRRSSCQGVSASAKTWSITPQNHQMQLACEAFRRVCLAYNEQANWQPSATFDLIPSPAS